MSKPGRAMDDPLEASPCLGSERAWIFATSARKMCPECNASPVMLRVPDDEAQVPSHPNMVVWHGRVDVVQWRVHRASMRD